MLYIYILQMFTYYVNYQTYVASSDRWSKQVNYWVVVFVGGMKNVTTTSPSSVKGTSSKFVRAKTVKATSRNVTEFFVTFVLQSFAGKKAKIFAKKDCVGFGASITIALSYIHILTKRERKVRYTVLI